jgi:membrane protease YdiL (CAAX protease family)
MKLKEVLKTKLGVSIELLVFFIIALSTFQLGIIIPLLIVLYIISMRTRQLKLIHIGFDSADIKLKLILLGIFIAVAYHLIFNYAIEPALDSWLPSSNLKAFGNIKGNLRQLLILLLITWIIGAVLEELLFRGYLVNRLLDLFGNSLLSKFIVVILASTAFGFVHFYQGLHGVISAIIFGIFQCTLYLVNKRKLLIPMIVHGTFDTISFIILYLGIV